MAFGKGFKLEKGCGGEYVFAAIVNDKKEKDEKNFTPQEILKSLAGYEPENTDLEKVTYLSPSTIIQAAQAEKMTVRLYNQSFPQASDKWSESERDRLTESRVPFENKDLTAIFKDTRNKYAMILLPSCFWIAVKRKKDDAQFDIYDPREGQKKVASNDAELLKKLAPYSPNENSLVIAVE